MGRVKGSRSISLVPSSRGRSSNLETSQAVDSLLEIGRVGQCRDLLVHEFKRDV